MAECECCERLRCRQFVAENILMDMPEPWPQEVIRALDVLDGHGADFDKVLALIESRRKASEEFRGVKP